MARWENPSNFSKQAKEFGASAATGPRSRPDLTAAEPAKMNMIDPHDPRVNQTKRASRAIVARFRWTLAITSPPLWIYQATVCERGMTAGHFEESESRREFDL